MTEQHKVDVAKMTLEYLSTLQINNANSHIDAIARQTDATYGNATFEKLFNVVFNAIEARVNPKSSDKQNLGC